MTTSKPAYQPEVKSAEAAPRSAEAAPPAKKTYRLRAGAGTHSVGSVNYQPGDTIESEDDLFALFPDRFENPDAPPKSAATPPVQKVPAPKPRRRASK